MAKTKEELNELKIEYESLNEKLKELSDDELKQVTGVNTSPWSKHLKQQNYLRMVANIRDSIER